MNPLLREARDPYAGGKPSPRQRLRLPGNRGQTANVKSKRRAANKRARAARRANR